MNSILPAIPHLFKTGRRIPIKLYKQCGSRISFLLICFFLVLSRGNSQTDFATGEIMFVGYEGFGVNDTFSFVLLTDIQANTVIFITDRGWSNTTGFRTGSAATEGIISLTFNAAYSCGKEIIVGKNAAASPDTWGAIDPAGNSVGTVAITSGTNGPDLDATNGDQLFIYQSPAPTAGNQSSFVTAIHMDGGWSASATTDANSAKPNGLADYEVVVFNAEWDNAKYDCDPRVGTGMELRSYITNENLAGFLRPDAANNWTENNSSNVVMKTTCPFCCDLSITVPDIVSTSTSFQIIISGTLPPGESWQLYTAGCGVGSPVQTTMSNSFTVTSPATEGSITYYVKASGSGSDCPGLCVSESVCVENTPLATCTNCNANSETCGDCLMPDVDDNPDLDSGCYNIKLIFVLDESGSIGGNAQQVEDGVLAFLNQLNGQNIEAALIEFSSTATLVNNYTIINNSYIANISNYFNGIPYNGQTYFPSGGTNWHDAMIEVDALASADMVLFFTDGEPTAWNTNGSFCASGATTEIPEIVNPVKLANKIKGEGTHMFMLGVGTGIDEYNLQLMSGPIEYISGMNTIGNADYALGDFATLAEDLETFVEELCRTSIAITKEVLGPICNGMVDFRFIVYNTGNESSTTTLFVSDTFPSGYTNTSYNGPPGEKLCPYLIPCDPPLPANAWLWIVNPIPPLGSDTLILTAEVLPSGNYTNIAWAVTENADTASDTFPGSSLTEDQPPVITCPANVTLNCGDNTIPANTGTATGTDDTGIPDITYSDVVSMGACPVANIITRTWTATDDCENSATCVQTITLIDNSPPVITCPPNVTVACQTNTSPSSLGTATASDACDTAPAVTHSDITVAGICPAEYTIQRTWTATDDCGNSSSCVQTIVLDDNQAPVMTCSDFQINCEQDPDPDNVGGYPSVTNNCGGTNTLSYSDVFQFNPCLILRTWTATDDCGNSSTCLQTITVKDITFPTITCPANVTIACSASTLPSNTGSATASDNCAIAPIISYTDVTETSPVCTQNKTITRTWSASDECGNIATCAQIITVVDNISPVMTCPANVTIQCTASTLPANTGQASGTDNCDPLVVITYTDITVSGTCPQEYTITRTWTGTDDCGNSSSCAQTIVIDDSIAPVITCPANVTIQCTEDTLPSNTGSATAVDNCDTSPDINFSNVIINGPCPQQFIIQRTWTATDTCGNSSTCLQTISVIDNTAPLITCPANITIECTASTLPANTGNATGTDNCTASPAITFTDVTIGGGCPQEYTITRTWKVTDACGNSTTCNQTIVVDDSIAPSITCPSDITIECTASTLPANTGNASASDNCDATVSVVFIDFITGGDCPQESTITRTWTASDDCGNSTTCVQVISIQDSTNPVLTCPSDITIECTASTLPANTGSSMASDNCDPSPLVSYSDITIGGDCPQEYTITRTWTATDDCGNSSTCVQIVTVDDSTPPVLTCPADVTIECTASTLPVNTGNATQSDNCDLSPALAYADITTAGSCPQEYVIIRTWTATDTCGNSSSCIQTITIEDTVSPDITCPADLTIECLESTLPADTGTPMSSDNCDTMPDITFADVTINGPTPNGFTILRTWTSTDACSNSSTCLQTIIVENPLDPGMEITFDTICSGESVTFSTQSQGYGETFDWMFGSGSSPSSAMGVGPHNVTYTYNSTNGSVGADVLLTASFPGCPSVTDTVANVHVNQIPDATIMASTANLCYYRLRTFKPMAAEMPGFSYDWNFGADASIPTANTYGPHDVMWTVPGPKVVKLIVTSNEAGASCSDTSMIMFNVVSCPGNVTGKVRTVSGMGIGSVTLRLFNDANLDGVSDGGAPVRIATTTPSGTYSMTLVTPGNYVVEEVQPANYFSVSDGDESNDNDIVPNTDPNNDVIPVTLLPQEIDADNVFVEAASPGNINGYVFDDLDNDGFPDDGEGIQGVMVELYPDVNQDGVPDAGSPLNNTLTSNLGYFTFGDVSNGDYVLKEFQPAGFDNVQDIDVSDDEDVVMNSNQMDDLIPVTIINGENDAHNFFIEGSICNHVVFSTGDDGPGTIRYILDCALTGDTITFSNSLAGQVIHLTSGRLVINKNIHIISTLMPRVTIQSDVAGEILIDNGFTAEFRNIDFISGLTGHLGAAFENYGNLILWDANILRNPLLMPGNYLIYNSATGLVTSKGVILIEFD